MVKKLKRKKFKFGGGAVMPSAQKPFSGFSLFADQLKPKDPSKYGSKNLIKKPPKKIFKV
tara:strand:- start:192 stop:371 length:180 start_codon:yes stop_codon:yes gene_type:complete